MNKIKHHMQKHDYARYKDHILESCYDANETNAKVRSEGPMFRNCFNTF